jgi:hypothetical protein
VLRIAGYQEHALRNVQPRQQRARSNATDLNSSSISWIVRAAQCSASLESNQLSYFASRSPDLAWTVDQSGMTYLRIVIPLYLFI